MLPLGSSLTVLRGAIPNPSLSKVFMQRLDETCLQIPSIKVDAALRIHHPDDSSSPFE